MLPVSQVWVLFSNFFTFSQFHIFIRGYWRSFGTTWVNLLTEACCKCDSVKISNCWWHCSWHWGNEIIFDKKLCILKSLKWSYMIGGNKKKTGESSALFRGRVLKIWRGTAFYGEGKFDLLSGKYSTIFTLEIFTWKYSTIFTWTLPLAPHLFLIPQWATINVRSISWSS